MKKLFPFCIAALLILLSCHGQQPPSSEQKKETPSTLVGGGCDGCNIMYIGMPDSMISSDTSPGWHEKGAKLVVSGLILKPDGRTPAPGIILYYYQTDNDGYYSPGPEMPEGSRRHGHIRGWVKSDADGRYTIYTIRPAPYPNRDIPAHIHPTIKEPGLNEYYIDEFIFDNDPLLTTAKRRALENRGGSGVLRLQEKNGIFYADHNIILGLHIPGHPGKAQEGATSGLSIGEDSPSFTPFHAFGPDKGSKACPVCKYGRYHGILYFVGDDPNWKEIKQWLSFLDKESIERGKYLKAYFIYGNDRNFDKVRRIEELESIGNELGLQKIALTLVPSFDDQETDVNANKINPAVSNTFIVYRQGTIIDKYIDLHPTPESFSLLKNTLNKSRSELW